MTEDYFQEQGDRLGESSPNGVGIIELTSPDKVNGQIEALIYQILLWNKNCCLDGEDFVFTVMKEVARGMFQHVDREIEILNLLDLVLGVLVKFGFDEKFLIRAGFDGGFDRFRQLLKFHCYEFLSAESFDVPLSEIAYNRMYREAATSEELQFQILNEIRRVIENIEGQPIISEADGGVAGFTTWVTRIGEVNLEAARKMESSQGIVIELKSYFLRIAEGGDMGKLRRKFINRFGRALLRHALVLCESFGVSESPMENMSEEEKCNWMFGEFLKKQLS